MKTFIVLGSSGFIGSHLVSKLCEVGKVVAVDKRPMVPLPYPSKAVNVKFIQKDVTDSDLWNELLTLCGDHRFDTLFNFGSPSSVMEYKYDPYGCVHDTIQGHVSSMKFCNYTNCKYVYPSSGNVYGESMTKDGVNLETLSLKPNNLYGMTKLTLEYLADMFPSEGHIYRPTGLRIFAGYGPGEERKGEIASVVTLFIKEMMMGRSPVIWGDGSQTRDFIHIDDIVTGIINSSNIPVLDVCNLGTGVSTSFTELIQIINDVMDTDIEPKYIPKSGPYVEKTKADTKRMKDYSLLHSIKPLKRGIEELYEYYSNSEYVDISSS